MIMTSLSLISILIHVLTPLTFYQLFKMDETKKIKIVVVDDEMEMEIRKILVCRGHVVKKANSKH